MSDAVNIINETVVVEVWPPATHQKDVGLRRPS